MRWHVHYDTRAEFAADTRSTASVQPVGDTAVAQLALARTAAQLLVEQHSASECHVHLQGYSDPAPGVGVLVAQHPVAS